jgi:8-oxo-dGTP diphosphatase
MTATATTQPLTRYPRPSLASDVALLTIRDGALHTVVMSSEPLAGYAPTYALPGGFAHRGESTDQTAARVLREKTGLEGIFIEQLYTFSEPSRDPRGWVVSVAYYALVPEATLAAATLSPGAQLLPVAIGPADGPAYIFAPDGHPAPLAFDHAEILGLAVRRLRGKAWYTPVAFEMVPPEFSLGDLQTVYEVIFGHPLNKPAFRKRILTAALVVPTGKKRDHARSAFRPPKLYRFLPPQKPEADPMEAAQ